MIVTIQEELKNEKRERNRWKKDVGSWIYNTGNVQAN